MWNKLYTKNNINWNYVFVNAFVVCRETYLQSFQYMLINRYLGCRSNLYKWNKAPDNLCSKCKEVDTIEHHLYGCQSLHTFWNSLFEWFYGLHRIRITLSVLDVMLGVSNDNKDVIIDALNFVILFAKHFIYHCNISQKSVSFKDYMVKLENRLEIEKYICTSQQTLKDFKKKWGKVA